MGDDKILKAMGSRIASCRHERGLTQEALSEKMDVSIQMVSNLEQGKKAIRPENLIKLCLALQVSADYILLGNTQHQSSELAQKIESLSPSDQALLLQLIQRLT